MKGGNAGKKETTEETKISKSKALEYARFCEESNDHSIAKRWYQYAFALAKQEEDIYSCLVISKHLGEKYYDAYSRLFFSTQCMLNFSEKIDYIDAFRAFHWLNELAEQNNSEAVNCLFKLLMVGNEYIESNPERAHYHVKRAASRHNKIESQQSELITDDIEFAEIAVQRVEPITPAWQQFFRGESAKTVERKFGLITKYTP